MGNLIYCNIQIQMCAVHFGNPWYVPIIRGKKLAAESYDGSIYQTVLPIGQNTFLKGE